jgi:hypothetical protein
VSEIQTDPDVYVLYDRQFIRTPAGRGKELRSHLAAHGIDSTVTHLEDVPLDRVDLTPEAAPAVVQAILDHWESPGSTP